MEEKTENGRQEIEVKEEKVDLASMLDGQDEKDASGEKKDGEEKGKSADGAGKEEDTGKEGKEGEEQKKEETSTESKISNDVKELRLMLREMRRKNALLEERMKSLVRKPKMKQTEEDLDGLNEDESDRGKKEEKEELTTVQALQYEIAQINQSRGGQFEVMAQMMRETQKYKDLDAVCTRAHFDDIIEVVAEKVAEDKNIPLIEAQLMVEASIWSKQNPYGYMYEIIKKHHPDYAGKEEISAKAAEKAKEASAKAPDSIASMGGGGADKYSGWTSKKIDALDEDELHKVPQEIYKLYMRNELP